MCQNERFQPIEICQNERFQRVEIYQTADISTNTEMSIDCIKQTTEKMNDSLHDFVLLSKSSARANLIRIASGRNT